MGRKTKLVVAEDAPLQSNEWYSLAVVKVDVDRREKQVLVTLQHVQGDQQGRTHAAALTLPVRRYGLTGDFLRACGFEVRPGVEIDVPDGVDRVVAARFHVSREGVPTVTAFKPIVPEATS